MNARSPNRVLDEFARMMTDAAGAAQGVRREMEGFFRSQGERLVGQMDLVQREEFEAVREMAAKARMENEALKRRVADLEAKAGTASAAHSNHGETPFAGDEPPVSPGP
ncbi:accessory factor UbiK family protein [Aureimonas psammosilenae]|uniref:accessory factor UbiK family protein n=1 Tax=Aureimonas psammosilenae TaxID=2495496 RepID=UPI001260D06F|nr:accessory factor UbiK family protein [Aureimonas psammosilenae]